MRRSSAGFLLPVAALTVVLLALALMMSFPSSYRLAREVRHAQARLDMERAAVSVESQIAYLLLTEPAGQRGLEIGAGRLGGDGLFVTQSGRGVRKSLVFDGRAYKLRLSDDLSALVSIQDLGGLINLNSASQRLIANALLACGFSRGEASELSILITGRRFALPTTNTESRKFLPFSPAQASKEWRTALPSTGKYRSLRGIFTFGPRDSGLQPMTSPDAVLLALVDGDKTRLNMAMEARDRGVNISTLATKYIHNEHESRMRYLSSAPLSGRFLVSVELYRSSLTGSLPLYSYTTTLSVASDRSLQSFDSEVSAVDAGSRTECFKSARHSVTQFPVAWQTPESPEP